MIRIFLGKPGGGKSYDALRDLVEEAVHGTRRIFTNLAIDIPALCQYIHDKYPYADFDCHKRLRILSREECTKFYLIREMGTGYTYPERTKEQESANDWWSVKPEHNDCYYVIDEAHIFFDAREWAASGRSLSYYNSQHRKFNDEVVFVTQFLDLLDKRVRGFAQEFWYHQNNGLVKFATYFSMPSYFVVDVYSKPKTDGPAKESAESTTRFRLDPQLAACYDTSAGVGITGRKQPEKQRKKGLALYWLSVPFAAAVLLAFYAPEAMYSGITNLVTPSSPKTPQAQPVHMESAKTIPAPIPPPITPPQMPPELPPAPVYVRSVAIAGKKALVTLSNGEVLTRGTGLLLITDDFVFTKDGRRFSRRQGPPDLPAKPEARRA